MFIKNSGQNQGFSRKRTYFLIFLFLQLAYSQICLQFQGSSCIKCAPNYQLVEKGCVSISSLYQTDNPILIFQDIPGVQKVLYGVSPVIVSIQYGNGFKQEEKDIVNRFQVVKVKGNTLGNFYEVKTNDIQLQNAGNTTDNSSILLQVSSSKTSNIQKESKLADNQILLGNLTKINQSITKEQQSLNLIKISQQTQYNLTLLRKKQEQLNLTKISQGQSTSLLQIKQSQQNSTNIEYSLVKINQSNLTKQEIPSSQVNKTDNISASNSNNAEFLYQLQQINLKLTQIGQVVDPNTLLPVTKINSPQATKSSLIQVSQTQQNMAPSNQGTINIQLTQVGQKLTEVNQLLIAAKMKNISKTENSTKQQGQAQTYYSLTQIPPVIFPKLILNDPGLLSRQQQEQMKLIAAKQVIYINWVKATRYQLYNLTYIPQSLIQVKLKQQNNNNASYVFKCLSKLTLFVLPNTLFSQNERIYSEYFKNLSIITEKQFKKSILADKSTMCLDPPFDNSYKHLLRKYKQKIQGKPILAVYYEYCGFAKSFRIFFVDDSNIPQVIIYQASLVVDLFRMMPQQVFFSVYDRKMLLPQ